MTQLTVKYLIYQKDAVLIKKNSTTFIIPTKDDFNHNICENDGFLVTQNESTKVYVFDIINDFTPPNDFEFVKLRAAHIHHLEENFLFAVEGLHFLNWSRQAQYCGVCGSKFKAINNDRSKTCDSCKTQLFPQTSIAVIVAIIKDGDILLAHNTHFPKGLYSLIAGFVELGETLEEAVRREVMEEVGLKVNNLRYFGSQPWPFPNSTMVGFLADYESGDINTDDIEIESAHWYSPDSLPDIPFQFSIARKIIDYYKTNKNSL